MTYGNRGAPEHVETPHLSTSTLWPRRGGELCSSAGWKSLFHAPPDPFCPSEPPRAVLIRRLQPPQPDPGTRKLPARRKIRDVNQTQWILEICVNPAEAEAPNPAGLTKPQPTGRPHSACVPLQPHVDPEASVSNSGALPTALPDCPLVPQIGDDYFL